MGEAYTRAVEDISSVGNAVAGSDSPPAPETGGHAPRRRPESRVDPSAEKAALAAIQRGQRGEALKILMTAYGAGVTAFALRVVRNREAAKDVHQQVFLEAFQGIGKFEGRSSLWCWLCGIAYHRCMDELRRGKRQGPAEDIDVWDMLAAPPDSMMDADRVARRRALEDCLGKLPVAHRTQLLMRCLFGLSYLEISEAVEAPAGTVQVRISRILPRLRDCLRGKGVLR